jgi:hypothetical protein
MAAEAGGLSIRLALGKGEATAESREGRVIIIRKRIP